MRIADKKKKSVLSAKQKSRLLALREEKQVARFLLPDAPNRKQKRKVSPSRVPCPLTPGTPTVPPPRKLRPWEVVGDEAVPSTSTVTYKDVQELEEPLNLTSTGPTSSSKVETTYLDQPVRAFIDLNSPTSHKGVHKKKTVPLKKRKLLFSPSSPVEGIRANEEIVDVNIEFLGFAPMSGDMNLVVSSPTGSSSAVTNETTMIFDETEDQIAEWEPNIGENPGSDLDEDELQDTDLLDVGVPRNRNVEEYPADLEYLSPHLLQQMHSLDAHDDSALRVLVSSEDMLHFDWRSDADFFTGERETFTGPSGPTFSTEGMTPLDIFERIWDETFINLIITETNRYANLLIETSNLQPHSRLRKWTDISDKDLWIFFAIIMLQSIVPNPVEREYWYPRLPYLRIGNFQNIMAFKKFLMIKKCLHFVDNSRAQEVEALQNKRLLKIKPVLDHLNEKFSSLYLPEQNIAIDESLLLWKGRLSFAQLIATKAARVGIKSYELCESRTGYLWKMEVYAGKENHFPEGHDVERESDEPEGAASQIVYRLVRPLLNKGHTLTMDNFYNSPLLSRTLKSKKTDTIGTLRLNREFVPEYLRNKTKTDMRTGEIASSQTKDLTIVVWKDSNLVSLISTFHKVEISGTEKHGIYKYKPKVVLDYNLSMGGVDKKDQLLQAFPVERIRNTVWYKKLFRRLLNVSIHNSYIIYTHTKKIPQRQFRMSLADEILKKYNPPRVTVPARVLTGHYPVKIKSRARCKQCAKRRVEARTVWVCDTCKVNLCIDDCFRKYHII